MSGSQHELFEFYTANNNTTYELDLYVVRCDWNTTLNNLSCFDTTLKVMIQLPGC